MCLGSLFVNGHLFDSWYRCKQNESISYVSLEHGKYRFFDVIVWLGRVDCDNGGLLRKAASSGGENGAESVVYTMGCADSVAVDVLGMGNFGGALASSGTQSSIYHIQIGVHLDQLGTDYRIDHRLGIGCAVYEKQKDEKINFL